MNALSNTHLKRVNSEDDDREHKKRRMEESSSEEDEPRHPPFEWFGERLQSIGSAILASIGLVVVTHGLRQLVELARNQFEGHHLPRPTTPPYSHLRTPTPDTITRDFNIFR